MDDWTLECTVSLLYTKTLNGARVRFLNALQNHGRCGEFEGATKFHGRNRPLRPTSSSSYQSNGASCQRFVDFWLLGFFRGIYQGAYRVNCWRFTWGSFWGLTEGPTGGPYWRTLPGGGLLESCWGPYQGAFTGKPYQGTLPESLAGGPYRRALPGGLPRGFFEALLSGPWKIYGELTGRKLGGGARGNCERLPPAGSHVNPLRIPTCWHRPDSH